MSARPDAEGFGVRQLAAALQSATRSPCRPTGTPARIEKQ